MMDMMKNYQLPGPRSQQFFDLEQEHTAPGLQSFALHSQLTMAEGRNCTLIDEDGNQYIDFTSGVLVTNVGHSHPHHIKAVRKFTHKIEELAGCQLVIESIVEDFEAKTSLFRNLELVVDKGQRMGMGDFGRRGQLRLAKRKASSVFFSGPTRGANFHFGPKSALPARCYPDPRPLHLQSHQTVAAVQPTPADP